MKTILMIWVLMLLSFHGCEKDIVPLNEEIELKYGTTKFIDDSGLSITIDSVRDGRCPVPMLCFWQGNAKVTFKLKDGKKVTRFGLDTYSGWVNDTLIYNYRFKLLELKPENRADPPVELKEYTATLFITND